MPTPRFSIIIPTRDRPATFRHTLATVVSQPGDDYEIIVADNCSSPATREICEQLGSAKIKYLRSDEVLPMAENWRRGLEACSGEYITVLGDDDGLLPSCLAVARHVLNLTKAQVLGWQPHTYWWPDTIVYWNANRLYVNFGGTEVQQVNSRHLLELFYGNKAGFGNLPMIYSAFVHRSVIDEACRRYGGYFVPADTAPDVASGVLNLHLTQSFLYSSRALSLRGNSGKSNGTAWWARSLGAKQREIYMREERLSLEGIIHKALVPSSSLAILIASAKLKCREVYFPEDKRLNVDLMAVIPELIAGLNSDVDAYDDNLVDLCALAEKLGVTLDPTKIPPRAPAVRRVGGSGPIVAEGGINGVAVDCNLAGIYTIDAAARLIEAMLPSLQN